MAWRARQRADDEAYVPKLVDELARLRAAAPNGAAATEAAVTAALDEAEHVGGGGGGPSDARCPPEELASVFAGVAALGLALHDASAGGGGSKRAVEVLDALSHGLHAHLAPWQLDCAVELLLKSAAAAPGLTPSQSPIAAFRCLGRLVFVNADRASRWHDAIGGCCLASLRARRNALAADNDVLHAALVCLGNLLTKAGSSCKGLHAGVVEPVLAVVSAATVAPIDGVESADRVGRLLSSGLRVLHVVLQSNDAAVRDMVARNGDAVLRALHYCTTFGVGLEGERPPRAASKRVTTGTGSAAAAASPVVTAGSRRGAPITSLRPIVEEAPSPSALAEAAAAGELVKRSRDDDDDDDVAARSGSRSSSGGGRGGPVGVPASRAVAVPTLLQPP